MKQESVVKRRVWKLKNGDMRKRFEERVEELVNFEAPDMWDSYKNGVVKACDEVCGRKMEGFGVSEENQGKI